MSTRIMALVWPMQMSMTSKAVLVSLADNANDEGTCWPSLAYIAERTCMAVRSVQRAIVELENAGHLLVDRRDGRHSRYVVCPKPMTVSHPGHSVTTDTKSSPPTTESHLPTTESRPPLTQCPPNRKEPSLNRQRTNNTRGSRLTVQDLEASGCDKQSAQDWLTVRKSPLTVTAWQAMQREAEKAGIAVGEAVKIAAEQGWRGFKGEWLANRAAAAGPKDEWWKSDAGIDRKAKELGVSTGGCKTYYELKERVIAKQQELSHA